MVTSYKLKVKLDDAYKQKKGEFDLLSNTCYNYEIWNDY